MCVSRDCLISSLLSFWKITDFSTTHLTNFNVRSTRVVVSVVFAEKAEFGSYTLYVIDIKVFFDDELGRHWITRRRYSDFDRLHRALKDFNFPCPELPPKQLWAFHTNAFIAQRQVTMVGSLVMLLLYH